MAGTSRRRAFCTICGLHIDEVGELSSRAICGDCAAERTRTNALELNAHEGESFKRWRARTIIAAGGILPDNLKDYA